MKYIVALAPLVFVRTVYLRNKPSAEALNCSIDKSMPDLDAGSVAAIEFPNNVPAIHVPRLTCKKDLRFTVISSYPKLFSWWVVVNVRESL